MDFIRVSYFGEIMTFDTFTCFRRRLLFPSIVKGPTLNVKHET